MERIGRQVRIKTVDTAQRSRMPFMDRIQYCDQQIVMAATGGLLTMLTESGSGTLAGGAHSESLMALAHSAAALISEVYQRDRDIEPHGKSAWPTVFRLYEGDGYPAIRTAMPATELPGPFPRLIGAILGVFSRV